MSYYKFHNDCQSSVLTYEQVKRLDFVMDQTVPIHGRGNFPTLYVKLKELIRLVKHKLQKEHSIEIRDVRLNGGGASYVLAPENSHYNDLDLIFCTDLSNEDQFDVIRDVVLDCLKEFYPKESTAAATTSSSTTTTSSNSFSSSSSSSRLCCGSNSFQQHENEKKESQFNNIIDNGTSTSSRSSNCGKCGGEDNNDDIIQICDKNTKIQNGRLNDKKQQTKNNKTVKTMKEEEESEESAKVNYHRPSTTNCQLKTPPTTSNNTSATIASSNIGNVKQTSIQMPPNNCAIKEAYVHKMVKVNDDDRWSLISLGVQPSESNSGQQAINGPISGLNNHCTSERYFPSLPSTTTRNLENRCDVNCKQQTTGLGEVVGGMNNMNAQQLATAASNNHHSYHHQHHNQNHQQQHNHHHYQVQQKQHRPKQFPNSIELKFVDRMRRKFEFSVDSFQIILDSLIQFYDYAPKPSFASQRDLMSSHPSSTVINTRPMIMSKRRCSADCCSSSARCLELGHRMESNFDGYNKLRTNGDSFSTGSTDCHLKSGQCHHHHSSSSSTTSSSENEFNTTTKTTTSCVGPLEGTRSYYQYQLDANSPSLTSEASSSGCSSSSSVVSSSSSSLSSCDEDHEDLSCDVDGQSSSSASTSSLLSSSVYSSDGGVAFSSSTPSDEQRLLASSGADARSINSNTKKHASPSNKTEKTSQKVATSKAATASKSIVSSTLDPQVAANKMIGNCCAGVCCLDPTINNYDDTNEYDFETDDSASCAVISENFYPTVIGRSEYGNFKEALYHLEKKLIATRSPEEIRGGGLLKYCNLLVKNYKPTNVYQIRTLERYMCSRFFIDFSDLNQQQAKLESYLANHFSDDLMLKIDYLTILHNVVQRSTVCLMNHELRLTLEMIKDMAFKMNDQQQRQSHHLNQLHHHQQQQQAAHLRSHNNSSQIEMTAVATSTTAPATVPQQQQHHQPKQFFSNQHPSKPLLIQSGVYRVKLVNYSLAKPATTATAATK